MLEEKKIIKEKMKFKDAVKLFVGVIIILGVTLAILGFNGQQIDKAIKFIIPFGTSFLISSYFGEWLESLTGNFFKKYYLSIPIGNFRLNVPLFIIITGAMSKLIMG